MTLWRLVLREIMHRGLSFSLGLLSVTVAVACLVGAVTLLRKHDIDTERIVALKEADTGERMRRLEEDFRKITKAMGFNILIVPEGQNLGDLYADDYASKHMPEEYADRLARSRLVTVRHLLPSLQRKLKWPEKERTIILVGTRGEVPLLDGAPQRPILEAVPPGQMVLGYELHRSLALAVGDAVKLLGGEFTVGRLHPERGTKDDITVWIDLGQAQELLHEHGFIEEEGVINAILALQCRCAWADLAKVREEVGRILPDTQVIELATKALARAEARSKAAEAATLAVEAERANRKRLREEREAFAAVLVPVVIAGCGLWIGFLALGNVRERRAEIGVLRAIGVRSGQVLLVLLARPTLTGLAGAAVGYAAGWGAGALLGGELPGAAGTGALFDPGLFELVIVFAPVLSAIAGWLPAMLAAGEDPAVVLREE